MDAKLPRQSKTRHAGAVKLTKHGARRIVTGETGLAHARAAVSVSKACTTPPPPVHLPRCVMGGALGGERKGVRRFSPIVNDQCRNLFCKRGDGSARHARTRARGGVDDLPSMVMSCLEGELVSVGK